MVSHHSAKFGVYRHFDIAEIMFLVRHAILEDHVAKELSNFIGRNPSRQVTILPSLMAIDIVVVEI